MNIFLVRRVVTTSLPFALVSIAIVTALLWSLGFTLLSHEDRINAETLVGLHLSAAKFCMWFLLGYGSIQAFGVRIELNKLSLLEEGTYRVHAQAEFSAWTDIDRNFNDEYALTELKKIDSQRVKISGDEDTSKWLFMLGVALFFFLSVFEIVYPAFK